MPGPLLGVRTEAEFDYRAILQLAQMINDRTSRQKDTMKPVREDDRADPAENGLFRMMPSGDIVDLAERE